jgi:hypothetical protein
MALGSANAALVLALECDRIFPAVPCNRRSSLRCEHGEPVLHLCGAEGLILGVLRNHRRA